MLPVKLRTIIEEDRFVQEFNRLLHNNEEGKEKALKFLDAAKWLLARSPQQGTRIGRSHVWFLPIRQMGILPVVLYYTFDHDFVNFLSIEETLYPPPE